MNGKNDKTTNPLVPNILTPYYKQMMEGAFKPYAWDALNFCVKSSVISAAIVSIQSPVKTLLINMTKHGAFVPDRGIGILPFIKTLYAGTSQAMTGSLLRTAYVTNVKGSTPKAEELLVEKQKQVSPFAFLFWSAIGETLVTGRSESTSQLVKTGVLNKGNLDIIRLRFNPMSVMNNYQLISSGFVAKTSKSLVNFYALCVLQAAIANNINYGPESMRHTASGMMTGWLATMITFPLDFYKDSMITKMAVKDGRITSPYSYEVLGNAAKQFFASPGELSKFFFNQFAKQVPVRAMLTGTIFAVISGLSNALGQTPAEDVVNYASNKRHTFFGGGKSVESTPTVKQSQTVVVQQEQTKSPGVEPTPSVTPTQGKEKPVSDGSQTPDSDSTYRP